MWQGWGGAASKGSPPFGAPRKVECPPKGARSQTLRVPSLGGARGQCLFPAPCGSRPRREPSLGPWQAPSTWPARSPPFFFNLFFQKNGYIYIFSSLHVARAWASWGRGSGCTVPHFLKVALHLEMLILPKFIDFTFFQNLVHTRTFLSTIGIFVP
jgi:hypothetical protein